MSDLPERMRAAVLTGVGEIEVRDVERPDVAGDEVLIDVGACGVCMTDYHIYHGSFAVDTPVVLGHESAGEVVAAGPDVDRVAVGDRVALNPSIPCGECHYCQRGDPQLCDDMISTGGAGDAVRDGSFAEYLAVPQRGVEPVGDLPVRTAALAEPYACCVHAVDRAALTSGDTVAVVGAGPIGLLTIMELRNRGAGEVVVSELDADRRQLALDVGADAAVDPAAGDPVEAVHDAVGRVDVAMEVVGNPDVIEQTHRMTAKGGRTVIVGVPPQDASIEVNPFDIYYHEIDIVGTFALTPETFRRAIVGLRNGRIDADDLVSEQLGLEELTTAFERMERAEGLKKQIVP
jgi:NADPH2:quinone reductase